MKKVIALVLAMLMVFALCACGGSEQFADEDMAAYVLCETGDTYSQGLGTYFQDAFTSAGGKVIFESFPKGTTDFTSYLVKADKANVDVIFAPNSTTVAANLLQQAADKSIQIPIMAGDTWESSVILDGVKGNDLTVYCSTFFDENDESGAAKEFVSGFKAYLNADSERLTNNGGNDIVAAVSALGFDAYNTAYAALEIALASKGDAVTSVDVANALWAVNLSNAVTGSIKFNATGDAIKDSAYIKQADNDAFKFVKVQSVANDDVQGTAPAYNEGGIKLVGDTIKVGVYEPQSGDNGAGGKQEILGIQFANTLKPSIDVNGKTYKIELDVQDNGSDDTTGKTAAAKLVSDGCLVVLGSYGSGVSIAASETFASAQLPAIGCSCTNPQVTDGKDYYFRICFLDPFQGSVMAGFAMDLIKAQ